MPNQWNNFAKKYTGVVDTGIVQKSKTGCFYENDLGLTFSGTRDVIVPSIDMVGLGNYVRIGNGEEKEGYSRGRSVISYDTYRMKMQRSRELPFDAMDLDESGIDKKIAQITGLYRSRHIVPELDAYNISALFGVSKADDSTNATKFDAANRSEMVDLFIDKINDAEESVGYEEKEMLAYIDKDFWSILMNTEKFYRHISISNFTNGSVNLKIHEFNGVKLIRTDRKRMRTEYIFNPGTSTDEGGFTPSDTAGNIRALILPIDSAQAVKKLDELKVFTPQENQTGNGWKVIFNLYYDLFVLKSYEDTIFSIYE